MDKKSNTRESGSQGESVACDYLEKNGYKIIGRNFYTSHCELDIIAENDKYIIFVEVKTRSYQAAKYGRPSNAMTAAKRRNVAYAAGQYLRKFPQNKQPRIDVIEIITETVDGGFISTKINHMTGVFGANGKW